MVAHEEIQKVRELTKRLKSSPRGKPPLEEIKNILEKLDRTKG